VVCTDAASYEELIITDEELVNALMCVLVRISYMLRTALYCRPVEPIYSSETRLQLVHFWGSIPETS